jgi:hypothetical protein
MTETMDFLIGRSVFVVESIAKGADFFNYNLINVSSVGKLDRNEESCVS